jgi:hypothetical protein
MALNPKVWGPHYWFVLHTIALTYPLQPNETIKKKYYNLITNLPIFIPISNMGNAFSELLDLYPVTPYLDSRESLIKWMYYIHNKINVSLNLPEKTLAESLQDYHKLYEPKETIINLKNIKKERYIFALILSILLIIGINLYRKS